MFWSARMFPSNAVFVPKRRGAADLKIDVVGLTAVDEVNGGAAPGDQCGTDLEIEACVWVSLGVECRVPRQRGRRCKMIDARREREPTQILTGQVIAEQETSRPRYHHRLWQDPRAACDATASFAWSVPLVTPPGGKPVIAVPGLTPTFPMMAVAPRIGHCRRTKDRETLRSAQYGGQEDPVFTLLDRCAAQR